MSFFLYISLFLKKFYNLFSFRKLLRLSIFIFFFCSILLINGDINVKKELNMKMVSYDYNYEHYERIHVSKNIQEPKKLYAKNAILMDAKNRRVLYEKNGYKKVPMASTTKIMTLLIALENGNLNDVVKVSKYAASMPNVQLGIRKDEEYLLKDLLFSLMLESHNDVAVAIAEHIAGSVEEFAKMMNDKANDIGAYHTNFVTPNGLDAPNHYTTAYDLGLITSYALTNNNFCDIICTKEYSFREQTKGNKFIVHNKNRFLDLYEGAIGVKTGFTGNAGYCFVGAVKKENKHFVSVVLASGWPPNRNHKWSDTKKLMDFGYHNYQEKQIMKKGISFQKIIVNHAINKEPIKPYVLDNISLLIKNDDIIHYKIIVPKFLNAPIRKNEKIGYVQIFINNELYKELPLYSKEKREKITYKYLLFKIFKKYISFNHIDFLILKS